MGPGLGQPISRYPIFLLEFCLRNWHLESRRVRCFLLRHTLGTLDGWIRRERACPLGRGRDIQHPRDSFVRRRCQTLLRLLPSVLLCSSRTSLFDLVGLAAEFLDCVPNLFICQVRFVNLNRRHWSCSLALCIRRTVREPTIAPAMNPITSPKTLFMV